ncbi:MAG: hypothetical protein M3405_02995 [Acidobacteriota bacterium]|jgi:uncharacterized protein (DUF2344 family)|nr:hypothetical protein [Acidobacteriota bacterium]
MSDLIENSKSVLIVESDNKTRETLNSFLKSDFKCENTESIDAASPLPMLLTQ